MKKPAQRRMHCPCGRVKMLARGLCATCYSLHRQDDEHFGGLREAVLDRDGRRCRVCDAPGGRKRSLAVHHRVPCRSELALMITLCLACHARVTRQLALNACWPPLLVELWREQHPEAHEQLQLDFTLPFAAPVPVPLFRKENRPTSPRTAMAAAMQAAKYSHTRDNSQLFRQATLPEVT